MSKTRAVPFFWQTILALTAVLAVALTIFFGGSRTAGAATSSDPSEYVRAFGDRVIAVVADTTLSPEQRQATLARVLAEGIDSRKIGRFVLGKHGRVASDAEQAEFDRLFASGIVATYSRHLGNYAGESLEVGGAKALDAGGVMVGSRIVRPDGPPVAVEWRLHGEAGAWRIVDLVIEGVSLALTLRSEYAAVIRAGGGKVEGLLSRLREQVAAADLQVAANSN
ncbi:MAG TPA: ABC transporter substrate-binding protein [Kiloniellales bacterium]|jgi:phospholipid transport system substrate-binding protein